MKKKITQTFIVGDEWLFFKFYCGPKTADLLLTEVIRLAAEEFLTRGMIDRWFFIRYSDPKSHLRVRFYLSDKKKMASLIRNVHKRIRPFVDQDLVWKVQIDTYQQEFRRYGSQTIELAETVFFRDSQMTADMLTLIEGDPGEQIRWLFALRAVDSLLSDFGFGTKEKLKQMETQRDGFGNEFGMERNLRQQLEQKFRSNRSLISTVLNDTSDPDSEMKPLFELLKTRSRHLATPAGQILEITRRPDSEVTIETLMGSYLHMMVNRLFRAKQRLHELVLYDFLARHYTSALAREKYASKPPVDAIGKH